jgi:hypothetical protein
MHVKAENIRSRFFVAGPIRRTPVIVEDASRFARDLTRAAQLVS